ncbi:glycosyltransferase [Butyrivibrio sp. AE3003]|uniref:glycosyltransferase n=1 Tax=Butyrivibrio sp. AE3003 TaxID=1496721 RepID=UPI00047A3E5A|nr:glycosyltransferase [Butyrivibrio sp. AE3003]
MKIWMDLTNSLVTWKGGVVGIIRAELEIAKNMRKENPNIKFCKYQDGQYKEVSDEELSWLMENESVTSGYINRFGRNSKKKDVSRVVTSISETSQWKMAMGTSSIRVERFLLAVFMYLNKFPKAITFFIKTLFVLLAFLPALLYAIVWRGFAKKYLNFVKRIFKETQKAKENIGVLKYPFNDGDIIFSCGWFGSGKEEFLEKVKVEKEIKIVYLIYDLILVKEDVCYFYDKCSRDDFRVYFEWALHNCDMLITGGETASKDIVRYCEKHGISIIDRIPVKFGSDIIGLDTKDEDGRAFLKQHDISDNYILSVGSFGGRKNYSTLYRAMDILSKRMGADCPSLVIVGGKMEGGDLYESITRNPNTNKNIRIVSPDDTILKWLYENCMFSLLASAYEGWSLTLPESLNYGKFVLAADNEPLRECGGDFCDYVDTFDPYAWAEKIEYYVKHIEEINKKQNHIKDCYDRVTWNDSAKMVLNALETEEKKEVHNRKIIYFDVTLTCAIATYEDCKISGILRTELMMIKYLGSKLGNIVFIVYKNGKLIEISKSCFEYIINGESLDEDYVKCRDRICQVFGEQVVKPGVSAKWLIITSVIPRRVVNFLWRKKWDKHNKQLLIEAKKPQVEDKQPQKEYAVDVSDFEKKSILFQCAPIGVDAYRACICKNIEKNDMKLCCIVYDFTTIIVPQTHKLETVVSYEAYLKYVYKNAALILYGGNTAQNDGKEYQEKNKLPEVKSTYIKFGSNISRKVETEYTPEEEGKILRKLGVKGDYILAVGTIEQRKNYETLYRAYVRLVENCEDEEFPQLVVCGHPGWNTREFLEMFKQDTRVHKKMIIIEPSDFELDILYRSCKFTVLASLYEGWSLTLPESLHYGKFCLCCDTPALREIAGDLSDYVERWDEVRWAEKIKYYYNHSDVLEAKEKAIKSKWKDVSWQDCAEEVAKNIEELL